MHCSKDSRYSITSLARASKIRGTLRPSAGTTVRDQRIIIIAAAIIAAISAIMTIRCKGLLTMCRSRANRVPSGTKSMPHLGHFPRFG
jgi:hypothetical protein